VNHSMDHLEGSRSWVSIPACQTNLAGANGYCLDCLAKVPCVRGLERGRCRVSSQLEKHRFIPARKKKTTIGSSITPCSGHRTGQGDRQDSGSNGYLHLPWREGVDAMEWIMLDTLRLVGPRTAGARQDCASACATDIPKVWETTASRLS